MVIKSGCTSVFKESYSVAIGESLIEFRKRFNGMYPVVAGHTDWMSKELVIHEFLRVMRGFLLSEDGRGSSYGRCKGMDFERSINSIGMGK